MILDGHGAGRIIEGTDPDDIANRVSFIEKTPRVRIKPFTDQDSDHRNWRAVGHSGPVGGDETTRAACDAALRALGYDV